MSRSGYSEDGWDCESNWPMICWRGAVTAATNGKRGQELLKELLAALDAMPLKRLASGSFATHKGEFCTLGVLGAKRGMNMSNLNKVVEECDGSYGDGVAREAAKEFGIARALAGEIMYYNDEGCAFSGDETPENRWRRMRAWIAKQIKEPA